jgi:hypothetical protein
MNTLGAFGRAQSLAVAVRNADDLRRADLMPDRASTLVPDWPMARRRRPTMLRPADLAITEVTMAGSAIVKYFEADVRCYLCGQSAGVLRRVVGSRRAGHAFRRHADGAWLVIRTLTSLRCPRCAGPLFAEEVKERLHYRPELDHDLPRAGRPRKQPVRRPEVAQLGA